MIGLILAILLFNGIAWKVNKKLSINQMVHIWLFTIAFQQTHDLIVEFKYGGYWYFNKGVDWAGLLAHTVLIPPVNVLFLNYFPFNRKFSKQFLYFCTWVVLIIIYEIIAALPEPLGYFKYGWWKLQYSMIEDVILLLILLGFYKFIVRLEKSTGGIQ
ncbi:hypothetical protein FZC76_12825 [Sutcliffiella horikoshii]|uniref:Uncharacterized protein n=2 Tax=Sutcliffiella horikoshii TaxID=79883 RepID=A0A5D4T0A5_9BACI|nr:hypothetical protein FZC76_12825 [Sutcliffiella horikoshii]